MLCSYKIPYIKINMNIEHAIEKKKYSAKNKNGRK